MVKNARPERGAGRDIDLEEATRLVDALEHDLARLRGGSEDLQLLRDEVEALRLLLKSPQRDRGEVNRSLLSVRASLENAREAVVEEAITVADYVARIGRMLGM